MDPITLAFYATICGLLGLAAPSLGNGVVRLILGAIVGIIAATALPLLRGMLGF